ncbi:MAG TPA: MBL fold metallo-hydrolase [archaeon]|nr:MBL fold metallo-hydrolase [archaeon]
MKYIALILVVSILLVGGCTQKDPQVTVYKSVYQLGDISITWLGHSSFEIKDSDSIIYTDPYVLPAQPDTADYIFISHAHFDHCSPDQVKKIQVKEITKIVSTIDCVRNLTGRTFSLDPGQLEFAGFDNKVKVTFYNAYNDYHEKDKGAGMLIELNESGVVRKIYHAGDTGLIPDFSSLAKEKIDVLLIPIGGKYTMNVQEAAEAAKIIKPKVVIPMHYNSDVYGISGISADPNILAQILKGTGIDAAILTPLVKTVSY